MSYILLVRVACFWGLATSISLQQTELSCDEISDPIFNGFNGACRPKFMVLGPQKCGTSTLWQFMLQHPRIVGSDTKEPNWFTNGNGNEPESDRCGTSPEDFHSYLDTFYKGAQSRMLDHHQVAGEWSATYLHCPCCPEVFHTLMPNVRLIAVLRDPIQRALSRYAEQHEAIHDIADTDGTFDDYVWRHLPQLRDCLQTADALIAQTTCLAKDNILGPSIYEIPIQNYLEYFPQDQLMVTFLDRLDEQPDKFMEQIERHLHLNHIHYEHLTTHYNAEGEYGWDKASLLEARKTEGQYGWDAAQTSSTPSHRISKETYAFMHEFYRPHVQQLKDMADDGMIEPLPSKWIRDWKLTSDDDLVVFTGGSAEVKPSGQVRPLTRTSDD